MKNVLPIIILLFLTLLSCNEKNNKIEFIQSSILKPHYLIKNIPNKDSLIHDEISKFIIEKEFIKQEKNVQINFYKYTSNTSYFLNHREDSGGFSSEELGNYPKEKIAVFIISKCEKDSTKIIGELFFYGLKGSENGQNRVDTLMYKCK